MSRRIVIVGGGASGTLVATHLAQQATQALHVLIVEPRPRLGEGVAYSTTDDQHLLNVPASGMSALLDDSQHFARWASVDGDAFVPRRKYADYLRQTLASSVGGNSRVALRHVQLPAQHVSVSPLVVTAGDTDLQADAIVIALGNAAPTCPDWVNRLDASRVVRDPWQLGALDQIADGARVLCIGTGLTFVDVAVTLAGRGCRVTATSRHRLLPTVHAPADAANSTASAANSTADALPHSFSTPGDVARWVCNQPDGEPRLPRFDQRRSESGAASATVVNVSSCATHVGIGMCIDTAWRPKLLDCLTITSRAAMCAFNPNRHTTWPSRPNSMSLCCAPAQTTPSRSPARRSHHCSPSAKHGRAHTQWASTPMPTPDNCCQRVENLCRVFTPSGRCVAAHSGSRRRSPRFAPRLAGWRHCF